MALTIYPMRHPEIGADEIERWRSVPTAIISDERNRAGTADASIRPLSKNQPMAGQALTVAAMAADNLAIHHAIAKAFPGAVLVIDAGGHTGNAVWGGITHRAAEIRKLGGVVIDGCVRDSTEIRASALPCYAAGIVPAGPHKAWGGTINGNIQVGRCPVESGDIIVGDDDGVAVVPFADRERILERCLERIELEKSILRRLEAGETTVEILGLRA